MIWLATKYAELALFTQQQNCYEEIEIVLGNVDDKLTKHGLLLYLGDQLSEINKEKALESYLQAMEVAEGISDQTYLFSTSLKLANLYDRMKKTDKAIACYKSALLNFRTIGKGEEAIELYSDCIRNSPPKEHIYYAIQDLIMLKQVPKRIEGLAEILNLLKKAFDKIPLQEKLSD